MAIDIGEGLLAYAVERRARGDRQRSLPADYLQRCGQARYSAELADLAPQRGGQAGVTSKQRLQVKDVMTYLQQSLLRQRHQLGQPPTQGRLVRRRLQVQREHVDGLSYTVVDLAGDATPLFLSRQLFPILLKADVLLQGLLGALPL